jgi:hypothetical protein
MKIGDIKNWKKKQNNKESNKVSYKIDFSSQIDKKQLRMPL